MRRRDLLKFLSLGTGAMMFPGATANAAEAVLKFRELYVRGDELSDLTKSPIQITTWEAGAPA